jgi:hypothetical protein
MRRGVRFTLRFPRKSFEDQPGSVRETMATSTQKAAARRNIKKAAAAAKRKRTIAHLPKRTRTALGKKGAAARKKR